MKTVISYLIELWASNCPKCHALNAVDHEPKHQIKCHACDTRYLTKKAEDGLLDEPCPEPHEPVTPPDIGDW